MTTLEQTLTSLTTRLTLPPSLAVTPVTSEPMGRESVLGTCQEAQGGEKYHNFIKILLYSFHFCSASNLSASESQQERRLSEQNNSRLRSKITTLEKSLEESKKENQQLQAKVSQEKVFYFSSFVLIVVSRASAHSQVSAHVKR